MAEAEKFQKVTKCWSFQAKIVKIEKEGYGYVSDSAPNAFYRGSSTASAGNRKRRKDEVSNNLVLLNPLVRVFNTTSIDRREMDLKVTVMIIIHKLVFYQQTQVLQGFYPMKRRTHAHTTQGLSSSSSSSCTKERIFVGLTIDLSNGSGSGSVFTCRLTE